MAIYTSEKKLTIEDLKRLRDQYNSTGELSDYSFMNELFHGLDGIIEDLDQPSKIVDLAHALEKVEAEIPCPSCKKPARILEFYPGPGGYLCADCLSDAIMEE